MSALNTCTLTNRVFRVLGELLALSSPNDFYQPDAILPKKIESFNFWGNFRNLAISPLVSSLNIEQHKMQPNLIFYHSYYHYGLIDRSKYNIMNF